MKKFKFEAMTSGIKEVILAEAAFVRHMRTLRCEGLSKLSKSYAEACGAHAELDDFYDHNTGQHWRRTILCKNSATTDR